jgi:KDO2-lipid IV(A) lauroyltransferase
VAVFALANDAPLAVGYARRVGGPLEYEVGFEAVFDPREATPAEATVPALTEWYSRQLETIVRRAPEQYWWVHRRWKGEPPRKKARAA